MDDLGAGVFRVKIRFSPDECDALPYNALARVGAEMERLPGGGAGASACFDLCDAAAAGRFVETLALFGAGGLYERERKGPAGGAAK